MVDVDHCAVAAVAMLATTAILLNICILIALPLCDVDSGPLRSRIFKCVNRSFDTGLEWYVCERHNAIARIEQATTQHN